MIYSSELLEIHEFDQVSKEFRKNEPANTLVQSPIWLEVEVVLYFKLIKSTSYVNSFCRLRISIQF
jgi:hypothetical protein